MKADFEKHRAAKNEFKEIRRYVDIWNDSIEKQIATNPKDASKPLKKLVPFFSGPSTSYLSILCLKHWFVRLWHIPFAVGYLSDLFSLDLNVENRTTIVCKGGRCTYGDGARTSTDSE